MEESERSTEGACRQPTSHSGRATARTPVLGRDGDKAETAIEARCMRTGVQFDRDNLGKRLLNVRAGALPELPPNALPNGGGPHEEHAYKRRLRHQDERNQRGSRKGSGCVCWALQRLAHDFRSGVRVEVFAGIDLPVGRHISREGLAGDLRCRVCVGLRERADCRARDHERELLANSRLYALDRDHARIAARPEMPATRTRGGPSKARTWAAVGPWRQGSLS